MQDKFKEFWLEKDKEEIIEAYIACIHNGEVLLARIEKAIEYIEKYKDIQAEFAYVDFDNEDLDKLLKILRGEK